MSPMAHHDHLHLFGKGDERRDGGRMKHFAIDLHWTRSPVLSSATLIADLMNSRERFSCHCPTSASAVAGNHPGTGASTTWTRVSGTFRSAASRAAHRTAPSAAAEPSTPTKIALRGVVATFQLISDRLRTHRQDRSARP